jgi:hypothetical protein
MSLFNDIREMRVWRCGSVLDRFVFARSLAALDRSLANVMLSAVKSAVVLLQEKGEVTMV